MVVHDYELYVPVRLVQRRVDGEFHVLLDVVRGDHDADERARRYFVGVESAHPQPRSPDAEAARIAAPSRVIPTTYDRSDRGQRD